MSGHGEKLSRKGEQLIIALIAAPTIATAAAAAGVSEATARRWLATPDFRASYDRARQVVMTDALHNLQGATFQAVATMRGALESENAGVRVRAARSILELALRAREELDFETRLAALEARGAGLPLWAAERR